MLLKQKSPSLSRNLAIGTFGELLVRPGSFLSVVSKVLKRLVNNRIVDHLEKWDVFF